MAVFLTIAWFVPWGSPTRRGGRRLIETVTRSSSVRLVVIMVLLAAALGVVALYAVAALPSTNLTPFVA